MIREQLTTIIQEALVQLAPGLSLCIEIEKPDPKFGDFATNIPFVLAQTLGKKPMEVAPLLKDTLFDPEGLIQDVSVAGGFLNFRIKPEKWIASLKEVGGHETFGTSHEYKGKKAIVEFVSANPTGPLHIGNARGGPLGDVLASLLEAVGYKVSREFYVNDVGVQIDKLGESILVHYQNLLGMDQTGESELGYRGSYVEDLARKAYEKYGKNIPSAHELGKFGMELLETEIRGDCLAMGIRFDSWVHEKEILAGKTAEVLGLLKKSGSTLERQGAVWFAPKDDFLADRECVLERSDGGRPTYFANDIAYHLTKYERGFDLMVNVWGSNHHGHVPRILAALKILGYETERLKTLLYQYVRVKGGNRSVKMSKRGGDFIIAREVLDEVGLDAFRFFLLMRAPESHLDFDLSLAKRQSAENPVYYIQYAHARICSIFVKAATLPSASSSRHFIPEIVKHLLLPEEINLAKVLLDYPFVVSQAAKRDAPHKITYYLMDLARLFQQYYDRAREDERYRVVTDDVPRTEAKLFFVGCIRQVLKNGLTLLGISAPDKM